MWGRSWDFQSEKSSVFITGIESMSSINESILWKNVSLDSSRSSVVSQNFLSDKQWKGVLMTGSLESKSNVNTASFSKISDFTSQISWWTSWVVLWWKLGKEHFFIDQINELLMIFDSSGGNNDSFRSNKTVLEVLYNVGREISDIVFVAVQFIS